MASQSDQAKAHRARQALHPYDAPVCPDFARKGSHVHTPGCFNHLPPKAG